MKWKKKICTGYLTGLAMGLSVLLSACSHDDEGLQMPTTLYAQPADTLLAQLAEKYPEARYAERMERASRLTTLRGKNIAYVGASFVNLPEADVAKLILCNALGCSITTYGYGGYGYATGKNLLAYVKMMRKHAAYVLWGTTNDYFQQVPPGTASDDLAAGAGQTACSGFNAALHSLQKRYPGVPIWSFTSLKTFQHPDGYDRNSDYTNGIGYHFYDYVDAQMDCCRKAGVPCLNLWDWQQFDTGNWSSFYFSDAVHMNRDAYFLIGLKQLEWICEQLTGETAGGQEENLTENSSSK